MPVELTELLRAVREKDLALLQEYVRDPQNLLARTTAKRTLLHAAADEGCGEMVTLLLEAGIPVDVRDGNEGTALHFAARRGVGVGMRLEDMEFDTDRPDDRGQKEYYSREHMETLLRILHRRDPRVPAGLTSLHDIRDEIEPYACKILEM